MKTILFGLLWLAPLVSSQDLPVHHKYWAISVVFVTGATALDALSSRGMVEQNPILGRGPFGARQEAIKAGMTLGPIVAEWLILRKHPAAERPIIWGNYVYGGIGVFSAAHNLRERLR